MGIFRTNNPLQFDEVDGIVIDETAPSPAIQGVGTGIAILVGQFERGPENLMQEPGSIEKIQELFGKSDVFGGNVALKNKKFSRIKIIRALAAAAVKGTLTLDDGAATDILRVDALYKGVYGNSIKVTVAAGTTTGRKYTVKDTTANAVLLDEEYDDVVILGIGTQAAVDLIFGDSKLIKMVLLADSAEPAVAAEAPLATGADGTIADTDYEIAIKVSEAEDSGNILFLDEYNASRNTFLKTSAAVTEDKIPIFGGAEGDSVATVVSAVATLRDSNGRLIYAFNWIETLVGGIPTFVSPASFYASILSQTSPHIDPAFSGNTGLLFGVIALKQQLTRADFIQLMEAGVSSFEFDNDIGFKIKSGVVTQIANSSKLTVLRRRMTDFLTNSIGKFLKVYQNDVNSQTNRVAVKGAILDFVRGQEDLGILPKDAEVQGGNAKIVDIEILNTDESIAAGKFLIQYKQRIFSSMRFIVLRAEIGESVVVTEGE